MPLLNIRTQIKTILESVTGIGVVHDYERWTNDWKKTLEFFKPENQDNFNGWMVTRTATEERAKVFGKNIASHNFLIRGIYTLDDAAASEKIFQDLIEGIRTAFRTNFTLNGTCITTYVDIDSMNGGGKLGIQVKTVEVRTFASALCHYCELQLGAQEYESR